MSRQSKKNGRRWENRKRLPLLSAEVLENRCLLAVLVNPMSEFTSRSVDIDVYAVNQGIQTDSFFTVVDEVPAASFVGEESYTKPSRYTALTLDAPGILAQLATAPLEDTPAARNPLILNVASPDNTFSRFAVLESPVMESGLNELFPDIRTYVGQGIDDPTATLRADFTPLGFHAQVLAP